MPQIRSRPLQLVLIHSTRNLGMFLVFLLNLGLLLLARLGWILHVVQVFLLLHAVLSMPFQARIFESVLFAALPPVGVGLNGGGVVGCWLATSATHASIQ